MIGCDDSYALNCVSYSSSVALSALDVTPLAFSPRLHIGLFKSVQVFSSGANLFFLHLKFSPLLREELSLTFLFIFRATLISPRPSLPSA